MHELINKYIPTTTITERPSSPWFNTSLKRLNNKKKRLYRSAKQSNSASAWNRYHNAAKLFRSLAMNSKRSFFSSTLPNMLRSNPKHFWKAINPNPQRSLALLHENGTPIPEHAAPHVLNSVFCSVFTSDSNDTLPDCPPFDNPVMPDIAFDPNGIIKLIDALKLTSSAGTDGINSKILKNTKLLTSVILSHIFQQSLSCGVVPEDWKLGKIIPVPKKGPASSPNNYRPISITSVCSKLMEHVIYSHVIKFLNSVKFFHPSQHGFQKGLSCDTQLALFINDLSSSIDVNIPVDAIFLDFEKAFDKVSHQRLFLKLSRLNLNNLVFNWICEFLTNRQQFVYANNHCSSLSTVSSGVPQGTVLGPLLFLIYINDLPNNISSNIRLFADDCVIYRPIRSTNDSATLQSDLSLVQSWCEKWLMSLNIQKTCVLSIHRRPAYSPAKYSIFNSEITPVSSCKYLGITITSDLTWSSHVMNIINDANRVLGYLRRNLRLAPPSVKLLTYLTLVRPKLEYACAVWDPHQITLTNTLESIQNRAARFIYSDYSYLTSVTELKSRANLADLVSRRKFHRLCLFHRFYHSIHLNQAFIPAHRLSCRLSHSKAVYPARAHTAAHHSSFFLQTSRDWNDLPSDAVHHSCITHFKEAIAQIILQ